MMTPRYIRPLTTGELLDLPLGLLRSLWPRLMVVYLMGGFPVAVIQTLIVLPALAQIPAGGVEAIASDLAPVITAHWVRFLLCLALAPLHAPANAAAIHLVAASAQGLTLSPIDAFRRAGRHALTLIGATTLVSGINIALLAVNLVPCIGTLLWIATLPMISVRLRFVPEVVMLEEYPFRAALGRSWQLCSGSVGRQSGVALWTLVLMAAVHYSGASALGLATLFVTPGADLAVVASVIAFVLTSVLLTGWTPFARTLAYLELRARREALDIDLAMGNAL